MWKSCSSEIEKPNLRAKVRTKQTPTKLKEQQLSVLAQLVEAQKDVTLKEVQERQLSKYRSDADKAEQERQKKRFTPAKKRLNEFNLNSGWRFSN